MPLIKPLKYETQAKFVNRCMTDAFMKNEFSDNDQRLAYCLKAYKERAFFKSKKPTDNWQFFTKKGGEIKDIDLKSRTITGILSGFGIIDHERQMVGDNAFNKTLDGRKDKIGYLFGHSWRHILNKGFDILEIKPGIGLYYENKITDNYYFGDQLTTDDVLKMIDSGKLSEHSIGFDYDTRNIEVLKDSNGEKYELIKEVKLIEGSIVPAGMNPLTPFLGFKNAETTEEKIKHLQSQYKKTVDILKINGLTDDAYLIAENELKNIEKMFQELNPFEVMNALNNQPQTKQQIVPRETFNLTEIQKLLTKKL